MCSAAGWKIIFLPLPSTLGVKFSPTLAQQQLFGALGGEVEREGEVTEEGRAKLEVRANSSTENYRM